MAGIQYVCPYCIADSYSAPNQLFLLSHIRTVHSTDSNFSIQCSREGCARTFRNFRTYQNHLLHSHRQESNASASSSVPNTNSEENIEQQFFVPSCNDEGVAVLMVDSAKCLQQYSAKWILKTCETYALTRRAMNGIVGDVSDMVAHVAESLEKQSHKFLSQSGVNNEVIAKLHEEVFKSYISRPFDGLMTFYQQLQFYRQNFNFIEPQKILLKETSTLRLAGRTRKVVVDRKEIIYIPLIQSIEALLNNPKIFEQIMNGHRSNSNLILYDYCDGQQFKTSLPFSADALSLQIILYYDELELCNPLGSRRKIHKIGAFYFILGNIEPKLRSRLCNIQLLLLTKYTNVVEFGINKIMEPFVKDIQKLESDEGVVFNVNGQQHRFKGTVSIVSADNPASANLGGFKQSGSAFRPCRHCTGTNNEIQTKFYEKQFKLRNEEDHSEQCVLIESNNLSLADRQHFSTAFGVNRKSLLTSLRYFKVTSGVLIPDLMHDLLEGVLPKELKLLLKIFVVDEKRFSLEFVDQGFKALNLRSCDGDKPSVLSGVLLSVSDSNLHQHAMQMWTMGRFLPLIIGHLVPEENEYWENFLRLLEIMDILFARQIPKDELGYLESLIHDHHTCFMELYPNVAVTPKMHSLIHMPRLILKFGPLINHWTTRFEAKHRYFKTLSNVMGNFTNICYSLSLRHQLHQCYILNSNTMMTEEDVEVGPGLSIDAPKYLTWNNESFSFGKTLFLAKWVKVSGTKYQKPFALVIGEENEELIFGEVSSIYVDGKKVIFQFILLKTESFYNHYHTYVVRKPPSSARKVYLISQQYLIDYHAYGLYQVNNLLSDNSLRYIVVRSNVYF